MPEPWAKLERDGNKAVLSALPLIDHCLDVGAAMEAIFPAWRRALNIAAGRALTAQDLARLCALAALHDLGKANRGFRARIDPKAKPIGHTGVVAALLNQSKLKVGAPAQALRELVDRWGAWQHFAAVLAHHGKPLAEFHTAVTPSDWMKHSDQWMPKADGDPAAAILPLIDAVRARWPLAWEDGPPLPDAPRFVALFAGLVTLADWIGSDSQRFPIAGPHGPARAALREAEAVAAAHARGFGPLDTPAADFGQALVHPPHGFQTEAAADGLGSVVLIEAETGSGKTEAALWRWLELRRRGAVDGLFFALPTRSAAVQLHGRVNAMVRRVWPDGALTAVLAVPGYLKAGDVEGQALPDYAVRWDDDATGDTRWAAERANRFLAARVAVGTIDQALLGTLPVKHALFRASVLARSLLVVDEVHASDAYMASLLERLIAHHVAVGGQVLLLSATLGAAARSRFLGGGVPAVEAAVALPYPAVSGREMVMRPAPGAAASPKRVRVETAASIAEPDAIAARAIAAGRDGAKVLVVRNSVSDAVAVAQAVAASAPDLAFRIGDVPTLHHGRFSPDDRRSLDRAVEVALGKHRLPGGCVIVGTQTLEQSLDIDADLLITDLAPIDVLLQRIGRLHRHVRHDRGAFAEARVVVLRPENRDLTPLLGKSGGRRHGLGSVYPNIVQLEATLRLLEAHCEIVIPRDNRRLVEGALHPDALAAIAAEKGPLWLSHHAERRGGVFAQGRTADTIALDLSRPFRDLSFPDTVGEAVTRLGARDLLLDLDPPLAGPFGTPATRIAVPGWMIDAKAKQPEPERLGAQRFALGARRFVYDQWGLRREA